MTYAVDVASKLDLAPVTWLEMAGIDAVLVEEKLPPELLQPTLISNPRRIGALPWYCDNAVIVPFETAPDGSATAVSMVESTDNVGHSCVYGTDVTLAAGAYTYSAYLKKGSLDYGALLISDHNVNWFEGQMWRLTDGTTAGQYGGPGSITSTISDEGDGWYLCSIKFTLPVTTGLVFYFIPSTAAWSGGGSNNHVHAGDGTSKALYMAYARVDLAGGRLRDRTQIECVTDWQSGEANLDLASLRHQGASLSMSLQDTADGDLAALFAMRTRRATYLTANYNATAVSALHVNSSANITAGSDVYIGGETFRVKSLFAGPTLGLDGLDETLGRGEYGSRQAAHYGGAGEGASVYTTPVSWLGRRATLKQAFKRPDGSISGDDSLIGTLLTVQFKEPPRFGGDGAWSLSLGELTEYFGHRRCYVGQREVQVDSEISRRFITVTAQINLDDSALELFAIPSSNFTGYVRTTYDDGHTFLHPLTGVNANNIHVVLSKGPIDGGPPAPGEAESGAPLVATAQYVLFMSGDPATLVLQLLLSKVGDGTNGTYDVLPGLERTAFGGQGWRFGAGIDEADIDVAAFEALKSSGVTWTVYLEEEMSVDELLLELCRATRSFWYVTADGLLSVSRLYDRATAAENDSTLTLLDDDSLSVDGDEGVGPVQGPVAYGVTVSANWDPFAGKYLATVETTDAELSDEFPDAQEKVSIESKFISVNVSQHRRQSPDTPLLRRVNAMGLTEIEVMSRRMQKASARARLFALATCRWINSSIEIGQQVRITNTRVPDFEGGTLSESPFLVIAKELDRATLTVRFRLMALDRGYRLAPVGVVSSWNGGSKTATLSTTDKTTSGSPGNDFAVNWGVQIVDVSVSPWVVDNVVISSRSSNTLTFGSTPSFTPAAGDLIFAAFDVGLGSSAAGYGLEDATFQVDADGEITTGVDGSRWS